MVRLIDEEALFNDIKEVLDAARDWGIDAENLASFLECSLRAKNAPTIEAEPVRHGRWNRNEAALDYVEPNGVEHHHGICSVCGLIYDFGELKHWHNFCPNCGARMDGGEENDG